MNCLRIVVCRPQAGQRGVVRIDSPQRGDRPARTHGKSFSLCQADEGRGAFAHRSPKLEPEVRDCNAVLTRLRSAWMSHTPVLSEIAGSVQTSSNWRVEDHHG